MKSTRFAAIPSSTPLPTAPITHSNVCLLPYTLQKKSSTNCTQKQPWELFTKHLLMHPNTWTVIFIKREERMWRISLWCSVHSWRPANINHLKRQPLPGTDMFPATTSSSFPLDPWKPMELVLYSINCNKQHMLYIASNCSTDNGSETTDPGAPHKAAVFFHPCLQRRGYFKHLYI